VAGRIRDEDIAEVREKARIDDVVSGYVTLRNAGGGSMKGCAPSTTRSRPSFHVTPARAFFHCFGCGEGGDVISFLMKIDGLTFTEAVERLADKVRRPAARARRATPRRPARGPQRGRLIEAHKRRRSSTPSSSVRRRRCRRQFLGERGFDQAAAETFGVGFAPRDGEAL
jgi:DNA primase